MAEAWRHYQLNSQVVTSWKSEFLEKAPQLYGAKRPAAGQDRGIGTSDWLLDSGSGDSNKSIDYVEWQPEQKRAVVMKLADEYPVSLVCQTLGCPRSSYYYQAKGRDDQVLKEA